jgi:hypothetical protein
MKATKTEKFILIMVCLLIISAIAALIESPADISAYDLGKSTGIMLRHLLKLFGTIGLIVFGFKKFSQHSRSQRLG